MIATIGHEIPPSADAPNSVVDAMLGTGSQKDCGFAGRPGQHVVGGQDPHAPIAEEQEDEEPLHRHSHPGAGAVPL